MPASVPCPECKNEIPQPSPQCPHCGRPGIFWNVAEVEDVEERKALESRYQRAKVDSLARGAEPRVQDFENATNHSTAVLARSEQELLRLASSSKQLYATYYSQLESGLKLPDGDEWDVLREVADTLLFPKYKNEIRFAALSLNGVGLANYGSCSVSLKDEMIAHRSSLLEENSALFMERHGVKAGRASNLPKGFRATWSERSKLCVAKLSRRIDSTTKDSEFAHILLSQGATSADDEFVEVHVYGPISVLTMDKVTVTETSMRKKSVIIRTIKAKLAKFGVSVA